MSTAAQVQPEPRQDPTPAPVQRRVFLVGNPNVGKSVVFNALTGSYAVVSNYPGTTVEVSRGHATLGGERVEVVDTPGMYSLRPITDEERVSRDILLASEGTMVHVVDAKNLPRMLPLTLELCMMGRPADPGPQPHGRGRPRGCCRGHGRALQRPRHARGGDGGHEGPRPRRPALGHRLAAATASGAARPFPAPVESALDRLEEGCPPLRPQVLGAAPPGGGPRGRRRSSPTAVGGRGRSGPRPGRPGAPPGPARRRRPVLPRGRQARPGGRLPRRRRAAGSRSTSGSTPSSSTPGRASPSSASSSTSGSTSSWASSAAGPWWTSSRTRSSATWINPWFERVFAVLLPWETWRSLFVGEYGMLTLGLRYATAIILPVVGTFFLAFSVLEDTGYLPAPRHDARPPLQGHRPQRARRDPPRPGLRVRHHGHHGDAHPRDQAGARHRHLPPGALHPLRRADRRHPRAPLRPPRRPGALGPHHARHLPRRGDPHGGASCPASAPPSSWSCRPCAGPR